MEGKESEMLWKQEHPFLDFDNELLSDLLFWCIHVLPKEVEDIAHILDSLGGV